MSAREEFLKRFLSEALRTVRLVRIFDDPDLDLRPGDGSMSTREQIAHIAASQNFIRGLFADDNPTSELFRRHYDIPSVKEAVGCLAASIDEVRNAVLRCAKDRVEERIAPFGPEWEMTRCNLAHLIVDHEIHHRGQLHVYARVVGHEPPVLYAPVDEKVLEI